MASYIPDKMKAAALDRFGGPEVLGVKSVSVPPCGDDEILLRLAAILHAGVVRGNFERQPQFEVVERILRDQKRVVLEPTRAADDFAVFNRPKALLAVPTGEIFAVEKVCGVFLSGEQRRLSFSAQVCEQRSDFRT